MTFEVKVVLVRLSPEENQRRIARLAKRLLWAYEIMTGKNAGDGSRKGKEKALPEALAYDDLEFVLEAPVDANRGATRRRG